MKKCCKVLLKIIKWFFIIVIASVILFLIVRFIGQRINNKTPEGGINEQMYVDINGTKQWISIYGQNKDNPVLLWLQAGPGEPTSMVNYAYTRKWSDVYTVVTWDKRCTGKTYCNDPNSTDLTLDLLIQDGIEMTEFLRDYFGKEKITLMGHSWGSAFGCHLLLAHPEYYDCYIGAAQVTDWTRQQHAFAEAAAQWVGDDAEGKALLEQFDADADVPDDADLQIESALLEKYCSESYQKEFDYNQLSAIIFNPYYSLSDFVKVCTMDRSALDRFDRSDFRKKLSLDGKTEYQVPYYNINGGCDYQCSFKLAQEYFDQINAPRKQLYLMEDTSHLVMDKSEEFSRILHEIAETERQYSNE